MRRRGASRVSILCEGTQGVIEGKDGIFGIIGLRGEVIETLEGEHAVEKLNFHTAAFGTAQFRNGKEVEILQGIGVWVFEEEEFDRVINGSEG